MCVWQNFSNCVNDVYIKDDDTNRRLGAIIYSYNEDAERE